MMKNISNHRKNFVRGILLPLAGYFLFLLPVTTYIGPFMFLVGGWYLAKWWYKIDITDEEQQSKKIEQVSRISNSWRITDSDS